MPQDKARKLQQAIETRQATIAVMGMGYVGVPLSLAAVSAGFRVLGFDTAQIRLNALGAGEVVFSHLDPEPINRAIAERKLELTADAARLAEADAILICVPTPLTRHREPDLSHVLEATQAVARALRPGQLVVLESTTYPGTTTGVMRPMLERGGLKSGEDFFLAFSPEREDPGNARYGTRTIPKVVGGDGAEALALAELLYGQLVEKVVPVSSPATAEAVKLTENIFRSVNIALVNELKIIFQAMDIDIWEVIEAAKTKPFGYMPFYPGPGLGGHCISIDPFYLTWKAREFDLTTRFIELAGQVNTAMPYYVLGKVVENLSRFSGKALRGARILLLGVAYKKNVSDIRESPSLKLMELLAERGAEVAFHDPFVPVIPHTQEHAQHAGHRSVPLEPGQYDVILIATDHDGVDYARLAASGTLIVDTRNACGARGLTGANIAKA